MILLGVGSGSLQEKVLGFHVKESHVELVEDKGRLIWQLENAEIEAIAVHTNLFAEMYPWEWMALIRHHKPNARVIIAVDDEVYDSLRLEVLFQIAEDYHFEIVNLGSSEDEIASRFAEFLFGTKKREADKSRKGKVVTVWSAASKDGATSIAINVALSIAKNTDLRVGLLDLNLKNPEICSNLNLHDKNKNHMRIRPKLKTKTEELTPNLLGFCLTYQKVKNLYILPGSPRRDTALDVSADMVQHLIESAREVFDVTIIDVHTFPDNAATISAVRMADERWLIAQDNYTSYRMSWGEWYSCYWKHCGIEAETISLIVNRASSKSAELVADHLGMKLLGRTSNVAGGGGIKAVHEGVPLYLQPQIAEEFVKDINSIAKTLVDDEYKDQIDSGSEVRKPGFWSSLASTFTS